MNDNSTGPLVVGLLFILRCVIPLAILFGISYLLQRLGLVNDYAAEKKNRSPENAGGNTSDGSITSPETSAPSAPAGSRKQGKKKAATPKSRSRNP
jgi:hypothetical protein